MPFFEDSHAIRALAVAYDMTGKKEYLDTCKHWSDRMIAFQEKMVPKGAYYMNYGESGKPSKADDDWLLSDDGSTGLAVFATAVRCTDKSDKARYLDSVELFAKVVMADRIGKNGGIIEVFGRLRDEWWCSTATSGALALQLYEETGKEKYRKVGLGALRWMIGRDFRDAKLITFQQRPSGVDILRFRVVCCGPEILAGWLRGAKGGHGADRRGPEVDGGESDRTRGQAGLGLPRRQPYRHRPRCPSSCTPSPINCPNTRVLLPRPTGSFATSAACSWTKGTLRFLA